MIFVSAFGLPEMGRQKRPLLLLLEPFYLFHWNQGHNLFDQHLLHKACWMERADFLSMSIHSILPSFFRRWMRKAFIKKLGFYADCPVGSNSRSRTIKDTFLYGSTFAVPSPTAVLVCVVWKGRQMAERKMLSGVSAPCIWGLTSHQIHECVCGW